MGQPVTIGQYVELANDRRLSDAEYRALGPFIEDGAFTREDLQDFVGGQIDFAGLRRRAWASEEVVSTYDYPPEYTGPAPLDEQAAILRAALPGLGDYDHGFASSLGKVAGTEGLFLVPRVERVAPSYGAAVERVFRFLATSRKFTNYRKEELGEAHLRQHERTKAMLDRASGRQQGDLLVLPGQFGREHRGRSMRRSRELFHPTEWGGGAFAAACMTLTHPGRFVRWEQLHVFCPGDEFAPWAGGQFVHAPYFDWDGGRLEFSSVDLSLFPPFYGSVSFRLPE